MKSAYFEAFILLGIATIAFIAILAMIMMTTPRPDLGGGKRLSRGRTVMVEATEANFAREVAQASQPVLVIFTAPWNETCKMVMPTAEKVARKQHGTIKVATVRYSEQQELDTRFNVSTLPTFILLVHGKEVDRFSGNVSEAELLQHLQSLQGRKD